MTDFSHVTSRFVCELLTASPETVGHEQLQPALQATARALIKDRWNCAIPGPELARRERAYKAAERHTIRDDIPAAVRALVGEMP